MTDVRNDDFTLINSAEDAIPLYQGNRLPPEEQRIGFETEIALYRLENGIRPVAASAQECAGLLQYLKDLGHEPQLEMASAVEYASAALRVTEIEALTREISGNWEDYTNAIEARGLLPSDNALMSFVTLESAKSNLVDRDRARGLVNGMGLFKTPEFLKVTLLCTSTQVSLSYSDPDDLFETLKTAYSLVPALFGLFANHPATIEGSAEKIDFNPRAKFYEAFGKDGGIPASLLDAKDGQDFIRRHAQQVFDTEMLFYYDQDRNIVWPKSPVRFGDLAVLGVNTRSNYDLAESFIYTDMKVCNIRDEDGRPTGKRIEVRPFDAGKIGALAAAPFIHATLHDPLAAAQVCYLLEEYGMNPDSKGWKDNILAARHAVANHGGKYLDVPFGNGALKDFCRDLGVILHLYAKRNPGTWPALAPVLGICESGISQAQEKVENTKAFDTAPGSAAKQALRAQG